MTSAYQYPIYRAPDVNLRQQIMEHFESLYFADQFSQVKTSVETDDAILIPEGYQMIVMNEFTLDGGDITIDGELFILDMSNLAKWADITSQVDTRLGATNPAWTQIGAGPFYAYAFAVNDECYANFHIPHDIVPGSDIHLHVHWLPSGTSTNNVKWEWYYSFAKGFNQAAFNTTGTAITAEQAGPGTAYQHMVTETAAVTIAALTEPDGFLLTRLRRVAASGAANADTIFVITTDLHYQTNGQIGTTNKAPDFYA
jgi:hypothetical protein